MMCVHAQASDFTAIYQELTKSGACFSVLGNPEGEPFNTDYPSVKHLIIRVTT